MQYKLIKYLIYLSIFNIAEIDNNNLRKDIFKDLESNDIFNFIEEMILVLFYYNNENFEQRIKVFEQEYYKLNLKKYLKTDFSNISFLLKEIKNINNNNYYLFYENCINNVKDDFLIRPLSYSLLEILNEKRSFLYENKNFTI